MTRRYRFLWIAFLATTAWADSSQYVPASSIVAVNVPKIASDPGIAWMLKAWTASPRVSPFRDFIKGRAINSLSVAVLPTSRAGELSVLTAVELAQPVKADDPLLARAISPQSGATKSMTVKDSQIRYVDTKAADVDFSAYALKGNTLLLGTSAEAVKNGVESSRLSSVEAYKTTRDRIGASADGFLFAGNASGQFAGFLKPLQKSWGMSLLLSADGLEWMAASFDVVSSNQIKGSIMFQGKAGGPLDDIKDDAEFIGEAFKRKFAAEKIDYAGKVTVTGQSVTLEFTMTGMEPLWTRLFENGMLSIIEPNR